MKNNFYTNAYKNPFYKALLTTAIIVPVVFMVPILFVLVIGIYTGNFVSYLKNTIV